jgi:hypothetical protein
LWLQALNIFDNLAKLTQSELGKDQILKLITELIRLQTNRLLLSCRAGPLDYETDKQFETLKGLLDLQLHYSEKRQDVNKKDQDFLVEYASLIEAGKYDEAEKLLNGKPENEEEK